MAGLTFEDKDFNLRVAGFIANRVAFNQHRSFSKFIIRLSIVATVISVAVMIVTLAFANGFQETVSQKVFSFWGHIRIQERQPYKALIAEEIPLQKNDTLISEIKKNPRVVSVHPFATKYAMLKTKDEIEGLLVKGLDPTYDFAHLRPFITSGEPIHFNDSTYSREIMLSEYTAAQLKLKVNDRILIYFIQPDDETGSRIRPDKLTVTGIFKTGIEEYDKTFAIGDIKLIQRLNDWDSTEAGGYEIFLTDHHQLYEDAYAIFETDEFPATWDTQTAKDISPNIFDWLSMQDQTRNVLIGLMLGVAIMNLMTCLLILVLERVKMVGILKALGASDLTVQQIFLWHSLIITMMGIIIGAVVGLAILFLQEKTGFIKLKEQAYYMSEAAVKIVWWEVGVICGGAFLVCLLVLLIPSILVRKISPVKAIRFN